MDQPRLHIASLNSSQVRPRSSLNGEIRSDSLEEAVESANCDVSALMGAARAHFKTVRRCLTAAYWVGIAVVGFFFFLAIKMLWFFLAGGQHRG